MAYFQNLTKGKGVQLVDKGKVLLFSFVFLVTSICFADSKKGTESEAKLLLERAVNLMRIDEVVALTMMTIPNGGFHQKDLYPFCIDDSGVLMAHPYNLGRSIKNMVTDDGVKVGEIMLKNAKEGEINEISYVLPIFTGGKITKEKAKKTTFFTRVGKHVCASGFYQ